MDESQRRFASEDEEAAWCLSLLRDGDRNQKIVARERLSQIFERRGLLDEVAQCLESNIREGVRDPRVYQRLSGIYRRQGRHELADEVLVEARRLAERGGRPPGPRPIRGGRPPGGRRPEPPPHPLEAPTSPLPASAPAQPPVAQTPLARPPELPPSMPAPPLGRGASALGELSLDAPRVGTDDDPTAPVDRPWWVSPPVVILGILLCGPFGAFVVAAMWVRGGYPRRARITAAAVWAGLMILLSAAAAIWFQSMVAGFVSSAGGLPGSLGAGVTPTPLVFPTPGIATAPQQPQSASPKPAAAPSPPTLGFSPEPTDPRSSPVSVASPSTLVSGQPSPGGPPAGTTAPTGERVRVIDTGGSGANIRERPGSTAPIVKTVPDGAVLQVVGADQQVDGKGWRNVRDAEGAQGWVAAELVERAS